MKNKSLVHLALLYHKYRDVDVTCVDTRAQVFFNSMINIFLFRCVDPEP